jgi:hypothetical protein
VRANPEENACFWSLSTSDKFPEPLKESATRSSQHSSQVVTYVDSRLAFSVIASWTIPDTFLSIARNSLPARQRPSSRGYRRLTWMTAAAPDFWTAG